MTSSKAIIALSALALALVIEAAQIKNVNNRLETTTRTPVNLTFEELSYIIRVRSGIDSSLVRPRFLTPCARAILACCRGSVMDGDCSESLKCGAFFFDDNPCEDKFILTALESAKAFYQQTHTGRRN